MQTAGYLHDANHTPLTQLGLVTTDSQKLTASGTTAAVPIFGITGSVLINALYGVVTTALGNCTAAYWRINDGTTQTSITLNTGTALTNGTVGAVLNKKALASSALNFQDPTQARVVEPGAAEAIYFSPFVAIQKTGGVTSNIEFVYTTSDTPTSGAITFYLGWTPLSAGATVTAL